MFYDAQIRKEFKEKFLTANNDNHFEKVQDEFAICDRNSIVDIALFKSSYFVYNEKTFTDKILSIQIGKTRELDDNHGLIGYEIKSPKDTLQRLDKQCDDYRKVFNKVYLITGEGFLKDSLQILPPEFGIIVFDDLLQFTIFREPTQMKPDFREVLKLLTEQEINHLITNILKVRSDLNSFEAKTKTIKTYFSIEQISDIVACYLCARKS